MSEQKIDMSLIHRVLPDYAPISKAPRSVMNFPEVQNSAREDLAMVMDDCMARESTKLYKAMDSVSGDIFLISNPICRETRLVGDKNTYMITSDVTRKRVYTYAEAQTAQRKEARA